MDFIGLSTPGCSMTPGVELQIDKDSKPLKETVLHCRNNDRPGSFMYGVDWCTYTYIDAH